MQYAEYPLADRGFVDGAGNPLSSIIGRDNTTQPFRHLGYAGYPAGALWCIDAPGDIKTKTLAIFDDGVTMPEGGTEIPAAAVVALLVAEYGWPVGTTLDANGMPQAPAHN